MKGICIALFAGAVGCAAQLQPAEAAGAQVTFPVSFGAGQDGARPQAGLINVNGTLYGTTVWGGVNGEGTVFALDLATGNEQLSYSFCSQANCTDGELPLAGLIDVGGTLYGTTYGGGANDKGTVFALNPGTGTEQAVHAFGSGSDGALPEAGLIDVKGTLYGTTLKGGANGKGSVFSLDPKSGTEAVVYSFCSQQNCADGQSPEANLIDVKGTLYGTTQKGGAKQGGTVFSIDPATGTEAVVYSFCSRQNCADGEYPLAGLLDMNGTLYGTTYGGGANEYYGTVFAVDPATGTEQVLYSFCKETNCRDGEFPYAGLTNLSGTLYGTTAYGGATSNGGTVFSIDPSTGAHKVLYAFCTQENCPDGQVPQYSMINVKGTLYGTTQSGGEVGYGTVFAVTDP
jgi:uncharacterized repeat protein (TIGR03803 family)